MSPNVLGIAPNLLISQDSSLYHLFYFLIIYFNWRIITLQYCDVFCRTSTWIGHRYAYVPHPERPSHLPTHPIPLGCPRAPTLGAPLHALNVPWSSILHMVTYMFQCSSLKSSHPPLLPLNIKVFSLYLCLFCLPACRIIMYHLF